MPLYGKTTLAAKKKPKKLNKKRVYKKKNYKN